MLLSRLSLPSIRHVLETDHGFIPTNTSSIPLDQPDASMTMMAALALAPTTSQPLPLPSSHLMKTIDFRDNTLDDDEEEQFSLIIDFPDEPASDDAEIRTIFEESRAAGFHGENDEGQLSNRWIKDTLSSLLTAVRKLLPVKVTEALLRKAVQH